MSAVIEDMVMQMQFGSNEHNDYMQRKLDHYNKWLLDPKREPGVPYKGFPEDIEQAKAVSQLKAEYAVKAEAKAERKPRAEKGAPPKKERAKRARKTGGPTKQEQAVEIFKELAGDKAAVISAIQERLAMSPMGAQTYYYNCRKLVQL